MPDQTSSTPTPKVPPTLALRARRWFLAGVLVVVPIIAVIWAIEIILGIAESYFGPVVQFVLQLLIDQKGHNSWVIEPLVVVISLLIALGFIAAVGWLSTFIAVRKLIGMGESLVHRIPVIKFFYTTPKEVISTVMSAQGTSYNRVIMFEYPSPDMWAIGFATGQATNLGDAPIRIAVFMPTTPNPTTGFLIYVRPEKLRDTNLDFEEAIRLIMSGGILSPERLETRPFDPSLPIQPKIVEGSPLDIATVA